MKEILTYIKENKYKHVVILYAILLLNIFIPLSPININRVGICLLALVICETILFIYNNWSTNMRYFDLRISSNAIMVLMWVGIAILCWFAISLGIILCFDIPTGDKDMAPLGFTYMLITDPGTILDSFKDGETPRILIPLLCLISFIGFILICGIMISVCSNFIQRRVDDYKNGVIRYKHLKDHIVIIGFDEIMPSLVRQKCKESDSDILILSKKNSKEVREQVNSMLKKKEDEKRIIVYCGRRDSKEELKKLNLKEAKEIYILGNRENEGHDALNIDCLVKMSNKVVIGERDNNKDKIPVYVMFDNYATFSAFQASDLSVKWREYFIFKPFNFYEYWAQQVIINHEYDETDDEEEEKKDANKEEINKEDKNKYPRLEGEKPLKDTDDIVNIIIFGITSMGVAIATQAAHYLHFSRKDNSLRKSRITFICKNAREEMNMFYSLYSSFFEIQSSIFRDFISGLGFEERILPTYFKGKNADFLDIEFEFVNGESYHPGVRDYLRKLAQDQHRRISIFISTGNDRRDINIGMSLPEELYYQEKNSITPIFVHQKKSGELLSLLHTMTNEKYKKIYPFGMIDTKLDLTPKNILRAQLLNQSYFEKGLDINQAKEMWDNLNPALQWSNIYCANSFELKLKEFGLTNIEELEDEDSLEELCRIEQNRWNVEKLLMGFRKPHQDEQDQIDNDRKKEGKGDEKFIKFKEKYIHDLIRPYDQLVNVTWSESKNIQKNASDTNKKMINSISIIEKIIIETEIKEGKSKTSSPQTE